MGIKAPPGFTLDSDSNEVRSTIKPPPGFKLDGGEKHSSPTVMDAFSESIKTLYKNNPVAISKMLLSPSGRKKISPYLPAATAVAGGIAFPGAGAPIGAGIGEIARQLIETESGNTPKNPGMSAMTQVALAGLPEVGGVKTAIQRGAQSFGRRALGFGKGALKRIGKPRANEISQEMLDRGVIRFGSGAESMLGRAEDVAETSGKAIGEGMKALDDFGVQSFDTRNLAQSVFSELRPRYRGGAYEAQQKIAEEIRDTILAHGKGPIKFQSAQELKETLQNLGKFESSTNGLKADMYRRASSSIRKALEDAVESAGGATVREFSSEAPASTTALAARTQSLGKYKPKTKLGPYRGQTIQGEQLPEWSASVPPEVLQRYLKAKKTYGAAETAKEALRGRVAGEATNMAVSLPSVIAGSSRLAAGDVPGALASAGAFEAFKRRGSAGMAALMNYINNQAAPVRSALISRLTTYLSGGE